ncbi:MAG: HEPN domain-containing protein [Acidobacteria bacterium]|nr:HEPN domain-containing protein [Acidobacteriota bacterium]
MNRTDLQLLSDVRVADAEVLLRAGRWAAAYYLLGYAVECGLKACAARQFHQDEVPDKTVVNDFYTHRLDKLLGISGVKAALESKAGAEPAFQVNWNTVRDWNETSRYDHSTSEAKARDMFIAVADQTNGVLSWLKTQW